MRAVDIIAKKRDGGTLTQEEIAFFVDGYTRGAIPDYQASAWLMAVLLRGMTWEETTDLTMAMVSSGQTLSLGALGPVVADKHSTGGVGDKTTLAVAPMVAAAGLPVAKMSGRGLGFTGGTLDKLESIPGFRVDLSAQQFTQQVAQIGLVVAGQSADLAPADGKLYALRDVTATVPSIPLIASSIMSKKIAAGANVIVLDVKVGLGAFMKTLESARELAQLMVRVGKGVGRRVLAVLSSMDQPLGEAVGNALEVREAIETLQGHGPHDFDEHCRTLAAHMLVLGGRATTLSQAEGLVAEMLATGQALDKFVDLVRAQGGDVRVAESPAAVLPRAPYVAPVPAPRRGFVREINAEQVGLAAVTLGAGRARKGEPVDHRVGIVLQKKVGAMAEAGEALCTIHAADESSAQAAAQQVLAAYAWSDEPVATLPLMLEVIE
ncbi:MAG TPA: pyrimidine-nucleoside phosphorylase [Anaerolineae bacterium]|nr:pyrimidine-nucleoside phosphorylase [Anaerolineae bacterium]HOQ98768.1 pyrimidine-nucleoside phosphorylase [Anaerolineae bacterium]HPL28985.1 pyrimidine-nucleoside phosphorylase [Anaerolineae bacterium]